MSKSIESLIASGTKLWLDSVDPDLTSKNRALGATGATSNPIIIAELLKSGRFDDKLKAFAQKSGDAQEITWKMTDFLVSKAEEVFRPVFDSTAGNDGYVSFELDPLLEDASCKLSIPDRSAEYVRLARKWSEGHPNRMIKVPATSAGLGAVERIAALGIPLNITLIFSKRQYEAARTAVYNALNSNGKWNSYKSVYSIFVSRIDVYTEAKYPDLSKQAQGLAGILNAQQLWLENQKFWSNNPTKHQQEIIFASTGTKKTTDKPWKYVDALAGSDIQTNPPATNDAVASSGVSFSKKIDLFPSEAIVGEINRTVDWEKVEIDLMNDGLAKFADPHKALIKLVESKI